MNSTKRILIRLSKTEEAEASPDSLFDEIDLSKFYFPGRGVIPSLVVHIVAVFGIFFFPLIHSLILPVPPFEKVVFIDLSEPQTVMYLPPYQGNRPQTPVRETEDSSEPSSTTTAPASEGLSYPGLQPILSDPPEPTNQIQTILQPKIENPEPLVPPLPLPNIIQTENIPMAVQSPTEPAIEPEMVLPELEASALEQVRSEDLIQPTENQPEQFFQPSTDFPTMEIPDLAQTTAEQEMTLTESVSAPAERMQAIPFEAPAEAIDAPESDFPEMKIPDLVRTVEEPEMILPESESVPAERMQNSRPKIPSSFSASEIQIPESDFPEMEIPGLIHTDEEPEITLSASERAPAERLQPSPSKLPAAGPSMAVPNRVPEFRELEMPALRKAAPPLQENISAKEGPERELSQTKPPRSGDFTDALETPAGNQPESPSQVREEQILILSPMPALPELEIAIPEGEARGRFAISPDPNLSASNAEPSISPKSAQDAIPTQPKTESIAAQGTAADTVAGIPAETGSNPNEGGGATGEEGDASDFLIGPYSGNGENAFEGITIIDASEQWNDDSDIVILEPMENPGEGIEIFGGEYEFGDLPSQVPVKNKPRPIQTSYSLSIISTEKSGGVLPSYNFFQKDQKYTVYLDMRVHPLEQDPPWILEFGMVEETEDNPVVSLDEENYTEGLILPFPVEKKRPLFPEEIVRRFLGGLIVVSAIVNANGHMEQISIEDSPDVLLNQGLIENLGTWVFRPAQLNRTAVAVKALIGIPLWLPEKDSE